MILKVFLSLLFIQLLACSHSPNRSISSIPPQDLKARYIDYAYNELLDTYYFIGEDLKLYSFDRSETKLVSEEIFGFKKIVLTDLNKNTFALAADGGIVGFIQINSDGAIPLQNYQAAFKHLPIKKLEFYDGKLLLHYSKGRPSKAIGYRFQNYLDSDIKIVRGNSVGFIQKDNTPSPFFEEIGFKKSEVLQLSQEEYNLVLKEHLDRKMLFPQLVETLEYNSESGWEKKFFNAYFHDLEYSKDLTRLIFTNKIEETVSLFDGKEFTILSESKGSFSKFSNDNKYFAVASVDQNAVSIYSFDEKKLLYTLDAKDHVRYVEFLPEGEIRIINRSGKVIDFTPYPAGGYSEKIVQDFNAKLARHIKLKHTPDGYLSVLNEKGKRIKGLDPKSCSNLLR